VREADRLCRKAARMGSAFDFGVPSGSREDKKFITPGTERHENARRPYAPRPIAGRFLPPDQEQATRSGHGDPRRDEAPALRARQSKPPWSRIADS